jgi:hypothetical protein
MDEIFKYILSNYRHLIEWKESEKEIITKHGFVIRYMSREEFGVFLSEEDKNAFLEEVGLKKDDISIYTNELLQKVEMEGAERCFRKHEKSLIFNRCPVCGRLARTLQAKQAPCGHRWL